MNSLTLSGSRCVGRLSMPLLAFILGAAVLFVPAVRAQGTEAAAPTAKPKTATKPRAAAPDAAASATPVKTFGNKNAPITMEVFSDYQCPSCRTFFEQTLRPLLGQRCIWYTAIFHCRCTSILFKRRAGRMPRQKLEDSRMWMRRYLTIKVHGARTATSRNSLPQR